MSDNFNLDLNQNPPPPPPAANIPEESQSGFNEKITSLEFTPPPDDKAKKIKIIGGVLGLLFILVSVPAAVYLSLQAQKVKKEAEEPYQSLCQQGKFACDGRAEQECYTHAGSGCNWQLPHDPNQPHWEGQCVCGSSVPRGEGECRLNCSAGEGGISVTAANDKCAGVTVNVQWFASRCNSGTGFCGGGEQSGSGPLPFNRGMTGSGCDWQAEVSAGGGGSSCSASDHGTLPCETPQATPTPTPPSFTMACTTVKAYKTDWSPITDLNSITGGQTVYFATNGTTNEPGGLIKARFRINSGSWQETTSKHNADFYIQYTIPAAGAYLVESMVFNPTLGWK